MALARIYELHTNEGREFRRQKPTAEEMARYIRKKLDLGMKLAEVIFAYTWHEVQ
ncbi:MAG: hypothetical protein ACREHV_06445 [Rhizomicrobium sp.]